MAARVIGLATRLAAGEITPVLHDLSEGGLAVALAKVCILSGIGATVDWLGHAFAEDPNRLIAAVHPGQSDRMVAMADQAGVPVRRIGTFGEGEIRLGRAAVNLEEASRVWRTALPRRMG